MKRLRLTFLILTTLVTGCATVPTPLRGEFAEITPDAARAADRAGDLVRWGGRIIEVRPDADQTCFEILGRSLRESARPSFQGDTSSGRFLACRAGFYDPAIFTVDRDITVTGRIEGFETRRIGEYDYRYPRVAADVVYLWPVRESVEYRYIDPLWGPPGYWWNGWYGPRWRPLPPPRPRPDKDA